MLLACTAEVSGGDRRLERPLLDGDARLAKSREDRPLHRGKMSDGRVADQILNSRGVGGKPPRADPGCPPTRRLWRVPIQ